MDDKVVDINSAKPHTVGEAFCAGCDHEWIAVIPIGTTVLECPQCSAMKGSRKGFVIPASIMRCCDCDGFLFIFRGDEHGGHHCAGCGRHFYD